MAKYKMLRNANGSQDGIKVEHFDKDKVYDLTDHLAEVFVKHSYAEKAPDDAKAEQPKSKGDAPENKADKPKKTKEQPKE